MRLAGVEFACSLGRFSSGDQARSAGSTKDGPTLRCTLSQSAFRMRKLPQSGDHAPEIDFDHSMASLGNATCWPEPRLRARVHVIAGPIAGFIANKNLKKNK